MPKTFFFQSSLLNLWARTEICTMRFPHAPLGYELEANGPYPWDIIWDEDLSFILVFTPEKGKIYLGSTKYFFCPPVPLLWCRASRKAWFLICDQKKLRKIWNYILAKFQLSIPYLFRDTTEQRKILLRSACNQSANSVIKIIFYLLWLLEGSN